MRVVHWSSSAQKQFRTILDYISDRNATAADRLAAGFAERIARLAEWPGIGRPGRVNGTRELIVHPNYIVIYVVGSDEITIIRVLHSRQRFP